MKKYNFNAGPCVLPRQAVEASIEAIRNFDNTGIGLLEISHRTPGWEKVMSECEALWRELLEIPDNYKVLFLGGGASTQFFTVPSNIMSKKAEMTTLTTALAMVPLSLGIGEGSEIWQPMGISIIGGLMFSTVITLVLIPVVYTFFGANRMRREKQRALSMEEEA